MDAVERARRQKDDFEFLVLCQSKGNMAMYELMRDRELDEPEPQPLSEFDESTG